MKAIESFLFPFYPPTERLQGYRDELGIARMSIRKRFLHFDLNTLWNILMILHSYVEQVMMMCRVQKGELLL